MPERSKRANRNARARPAHKPLLVTAAVIHRDGKVLIGQRPRKGRHPLKWEFPGGKVESGETPQQGLVRELREELQIEAAIGPEIARYRHHYPNGRGVDLLFFSVDNFSGAPVPRAFEQICWADISALPSIDFLEGDLDFIHRLARGELKL